MALSMLSAAGAVLLKVKMHNITKVKKLGTDITLQNAFETCHTTEARGHKVARCGLLEESRSTSTSVDLDMLSEISVIER
jgi:hypothetical protein